MKETFEKLSNVIGKIAKENQNRMKQEEHICLSVVLDGEIIGHKTDTFWSLSKNGYKAHSLGNDERLVKNYLSMLNSKGDDIFSNIFKVRNEKLQEENKLKILVTRINGIDTEIIKIHSLNKVEGIFISEFKLVTLKEFENEN